MVPAEMKTMSSVEVTPRTRDFNVVSARFLIAEVLKSAVSEAAFLAVAGDGNLAGVDDVGKVFSGGVVGGEQTSDDAEEENLASVVVSSTLNPGLF